MINPTTLHFLSELKLNNNKDWFTIHKSDYTLALENMIEFADDVILQMNKHDVLENTSGKKSLYRIYKDVRFSKGKTPYNPRFSFGLQRASAERRGGYYVHIEPGNSFVGCGFFAPNPNDLKRIRLDIASNYDEWEAILQSKNIKENFGTLTGEKVLTAPKGFSKDHPAIELLRFKQYLLIKNYTDAEVLTPDFATEVNRILKSVRGYFDYMSEVLTTNINGESIL